MIQREEKRAEKKDQEIYFVIKSTYEKFYGESFVLKGLQAKFVCSMSVHARNGIFGTKLWLLKGASDSTKVNIVKLDGVDLLVTNPLCVLYHH